MSVTKAKLFDQKQNRTAELAKAMAHPARIAILQLLAERPNCICGDITDELPLAQSTISQHLKALKEAGIIKGEVDGVRVCYCLNEEVVNEFEQLFDSLTEELTKSITKNCC